MQHSPFARLLALASLSLPIAACGGRALADIPDLSAAPEDSSSDGGAAETARAIGAPAKSDASQASDSKPPTSNANAPKSPAPPPNAPPGSPASCSVTTTTNATQNDARDCIPGNVWRDLAKSDCVRMGLDLADFVVGDACGAGYRTVRFACCPRPGEGTPPRSQPAPPQPTPAPANCVSGRIASEMCATYDVLKRAAYDECTSSGHDVLVDLKTDDPCPSGFRTLNYACCTAPK